MNTVDKYNPPKKVRCIRIVGVEHLISAEKTYEATELFTDNGIEFYRLSVAGAPVCSGLGFFASRFAPIESDTQMDVTMALMSVSQESQAPAMIQTFDFDTYNSLRGLPGRRE